MDLAQSPAPAQGCAAEQKSCAACGEKFGCSATAEHCWCKDVKVGEEVLAALRARYSDCLCPRCLAAAASGDEGISA